MASRQVVSRKALSKSTAAGRYGIGKPSVIMIQLEKQKRLITNLFQFALHGRVIFDDHRRSLAIISS